MYIKTGVGRLKVLERVSSKFGNSCHVFVPKSSIGKNLKVIIGNSRFSGKEIVIDFFGTEILERKVTSLGTGAHIILPKETLGLKIKIIGGENE